MIYSFLFCFVLSSFSCFASTKADDELTPWGYSLPTNSGPRIPHPPASVRQLFEHEGPLNSVRFFSRFPCFLPTKTAIRVSSSLSSNLRNRSLRRTPTQKRFLEMSREKSGELTKFRTPIPPMQLVSDPACFSQQLSLNRMSHGDAAPATLMSLSLPLLETNSSCIIIHRKTSKNVSKTYKAEKKGRRRSGLGWWSHLTSVVP